TQTSKYVERFRSLEVERQRLFRSVRPHEVTRQSLHRMVVRARKVTYAGPFDLDDAGAEVRQLTTGKGRRDGLLDGHDEETVQRQLRRHVVEINRCRSSVVRAMRTLAASIIRPSCVAAPWPALTALSYASTIAAAFATSASDGENAAFTVA